MQGIRMGLLHNVAFSTFCLQRQISLVDDIDLALCVSSNKKYLFLVRELFSLILARVSSFTRSSKGRASTLFLLRSLIKQMPQTFWVIGFRQDLRVGSIFQNISTNDRA